MTDLHLCNSCQNQQLQVFDFKAYHKNSGPHSTMIRKSYEFVTLIV